MGTSASFGIRKSADSQRSGWLLAMVTKGLSQFQRWPWFWAPLLLLPWGRTPHRGIKGIRPALFLRWLSKYFFQDPKTRWNESSRFLIDQDLMISSFHFSFPSRNIFQIDPKLRSLYYILNYRRHGNLTFFLKIIYLAASGLCCGAPDLCRVLHGLSLWLDGL